MLQKSMAETGRLTFAQPTGSGEEIDLGQVLHTIWRGKWLIALVTALVIFAGGYYAFVSATRLYTAHSVVALENREEQVVDLDSVVSGLAGDQATVNTEVEVIRSRVLIGRVVDQLALTEDPEFNAELRPPPEFSLRRTIRSLIVGAIELVRGPAPPAAPRERGPGEIRDATIDAVLGTLTVRNLDRSYVFRISVVTTDPVKSAAIANTLADTYIRDQLELKFEATENATAWLTERVAELQLELEAAEAAVKEFNAAADLVSPEGLEALNRQSKDLRDRVAAARAAMAAADERLAALVAAAEQGDRAAMAALADDRSLDRLLRMLEGGATTDDSGFRARYDQIVERARLERDRAAAQADSLSTSLAGIEARIREQSADLVELQQLQREAEANRLIYESFLTRLKEISVQQGIQQADARILSPAVVPRGASSPKKPMILAVAMLLGLIVGTGLVLGRELMQNTIRSAEDLEAATGHTVMGQIPMIPARRRRRVIEYLAQKPSSPAAEAIRNLRTSVLLSNVDSPPQIIMTTSSIPGEGKTTQSIALAQNLSGLGKKVLLVEGDIRRRVFSQYFRISEPRGLLAVLAGEAKLGDVVHHEPTLNADVLIGEKSSVNAADIFSSEAFERFLGEARETYDVVLIDTPPVLVVPDARVIGQSCDAILYSVKWDSTSRSQVIEGLRQFAMVNLKVTGLVLTQIDPAGMRRYGYGDRYGAYSSYGRGYYDG